MKEKSREIFGNKMPQKVYRKAVKSKKKFQKKFGDDSKVDYPVVLKENAHIGDFLGVVDVLLPEQKEASKLEFDKEKGIIVGNIRMGFGHYRISMAIARRSLAHRMICILWVLDFPVRVSSLINWCGSQ